MIKKRGLGKGINALIPDINEETIDARAGILQAGIDEIKTNPSQPRKSFFEDKIEELAASIKEKGILQPLLVRRDGPQYELIAGERRLRAAYKAGLTTVPIIIKEADENTRQEIALIENIQREDLNIVEEAEAYQNLIGRFGFTQEEVSQRVGKSRTAVTNALRILKLDKKIKVDLLQNRITMGHARAYLGLESSAQQQEVHRRVIKKGLSVRQTEHLIKRLKNDKLENIQKSEKTLEKDLQYDFIINELQKRFSTKVNIVKKGKKGKLIIEFYSDSEFERIYDLLRG